MGVDLPAVLSCQAHFTAPHWLRWCWFSHHPLCISSQLVKISFLGIPLGCHGSVGCQHGLSNWSWTKDLLRVMPMPHTPQVRLCRMPHLASRGVSLTNLISGSSAFSKTSLNIRKFTVHVLLKPGLESKNPNFTGEKNETNTIMGHCSA